MKKTIITLIGLAALSLAGVQAQVLVAGWDFQTTTTNGTAVAAPSSTQTVFNANFGSGTLYLNGTNGASSWAAATELSAFSGTALNNGTVMSTTTTSPACLAVLGGTSNSANGKSIVFKFSMSGYQNLIVSYATQKTNTGFSSQVWDLSTDGSSWSSLGTVSSIPTSWAVQTLSTTTVLDNQANAYVRVTFDGATSATGNNRLDNIQFQANASAVPEPSTWALIALGSAFVVWRTRRKSVC